MKKILFILGMLGLLLQAEGQSIIITSSPTGSAHLASSAVDSASWESEYKTFYYDLPVASRPSVDTAHKYNDFIVSLSGAGILDSIDEMFILVAKDTTMAFQSYINPSTDSGVSVNSPDFSAYTGVDFNGSDNYLKSGYTPSVDAVAYGQNDALLAVYVLENVSEDRVDIGGGDAITIDNLSIFSRTNADRVGVRINSDGAGDSDANITDARGFIVGIRRNSSTQLAFKNGNNNIITDTETSQPVDDEIYVGAMNNNGTAGLYSTKTIGFFAVGGNISNAKIESFKDAIETLFDYLGVGVI